MENVVINCKYFVHRANFFLSLIYFRQFLGQCDCVSVLLTVCFHVQVCALFVNKINLIRYSLLPVTLGLYCQRLNAGNVHH